MQDLGGRLRKNNRRRKRELKERKQILHRGGRGEDRILKSVMVLFRKQKKERGRQSKGGKDGRLEAYPTKKDREEPTGGWKEGSRSDRNKTTFLTLQIELNLNSAQTTSLKKKKSCLMKFEVRTGGCCRNKEKRGLGTQSRRA